MRKCVVAFLVFNVYVMADVTQIIQSSLHDELDVGQTTANLYHVVFLGSCFS